MISTEPASPDAPLAAVTGATGFIGRHLVSALAQAGWRVRVLVRREPRIPDWRGLSPEVVPGTLADAAALERLVEGADAVIHAAGLIKAARRREFFEVNGAASASLAGIARRLAPQGHFVLVSTLAAREPGISDYAASKRAGEDAVREILGSRVTVLRPAAVYGPADPETLRFFQLARHRIVALPAPPQARVALIHVQDLARLIVKMAASEPQGEVLSAADAQPAGYGWAEILGMAARTVGNPHARLVRAPRALLHTVAWAGDVGRLLGSATMLNSHKLREISHLDWSVSPAEQARPAGWTPRFEIESGFADTVAWYRAAGWLPR
ncbi:MAG: SDR family NAD(P)-dependent oxidoreductase [Betaproteobacteria bacterium]|nr:SDR family NAD(P)-dependent oxidoreductase [Betaproteobacteria bacterium]